MAEEAKNSAAAHAAEIEALKRQIEEMNKRLEELSAATSAGVPAEGDSSALAASAEVAGVAEVVNPRFKREATPRKRAALKRQTSLREKAFTHPTPLRAPRKRLRQNRLRVAKPVATKAKSCHATKRRNRWIALKPGQAEARLRARFHPRRPLPIRV